MESKICAGWADFGALRMDGHGSQPGRPIAASSGDGPAGCRMAPPDPQKRPPVLRAVPASPAGLTGGFYYELTQTIEIVKDTADAVEARWQDMHQEAADELARVERHHPVVSLGAVKAIILPLEGDALVVGRDQAAVGDGDAVGVARKIAQDFLRAPEWTLGIDDPVFVAQRCQIIREGF